MKPLLLLLLLLVAPGVVGCGESEEEAPVLTPVDLDLDENEFDEPTKMLETSLEIKETDDEITNRQLNAPEAKQDTTESGKNQPQRETKKGVTKTLSLRIAAAPATVLETYFTALSKGKLREAAKEVVVPEKPELRSALRKRLNTLASLTQSGQLEVIPLESRISSNWSLVVTHIRMRQQGKVRRGLQEHYLLHINNRWKLVPKAIQTDAAVQAQNGIGYKKLATWYKAHKARLQTKYRELPSDAS